MFQKDVLLLLGFFSENALTIFIVISLELKYHLILILKACAVQISSQIKFA